MYRPQLLKLLQRFERRFQSMEYSSNRAWSSIPNEAEVDKAKNTAQEILSEFQAHPANNHNFFKYLRDISKDGFSAGQYLIYRDNFFYRTARTVVSAAIHASKAVDNHDYAALAGSAQNVADEGGHGDLEGVHLKLLEDSHNAFGKRIFGIPEVTIAGSKDSPFLTQAVLNFRKTQQKLFRSSYPTMTGCLLAHEDAADQMLINFRQSIFEPYRGYYTEKEFKGLMQYYDAHRDDSKEGGNVEERHKEQALEIAARIIAKNSRAAKLMLAGGNKFLTAQGQLWSEMEDSMERAKANGQRVAPRSEFLPVVPSGAVSKFSSTNLKDSKPQDRSK